MNKMSLRMARLEEEGMLMVELDRMSEGDLRQKIASMLDKASVIRAQINQMSFEDVAEKLAECRGELGLVMRECELRALR